MSMFLAGFALVQSLVLIAAMAAPVFFDEKPNFDAPIVPLFVAPLLSAWLGAELARAIRRPRLLDERLRRPIARACRGGLASVLATIPASFGVALLAGTFSDTAVTGACALTSAALITLLMARQRPGTCVHCAYDLRGIPSTAPCPECGARPVHEQSAPPHLS